MSASLKNMRKFEDSSKDEGGKLAYKSIKTINFFPSNSYLSFEIYFKEIKLFSLVFMENGYQFYFLNSLGTLVEKKQFIEFNSISCAISRVDEYYFNIAYYASCVLGVEDNGRNMEKELRNFLENLPISLSLNPSLMCHEVHLNYHYPFKEKRFQMYISKKRMENKDSILNLVKGRKSAHEPHKKGEGKIKKKRGELRGETAAAAQAATRVAKREKEKQPQDGYNLQQQI
ncbi:hypothetical protein M9H77_03228 [Catharanthus roseus]|uniref:Uncharacterized protein n=1 Tax=Catharanthus roseus TaxID=4058 RepID=A0ACC0CAU8_CATRO|nr:hypothetical protein M9H77_03228 [Catharanthus roseus]